MFEPKLLQSSITDTIFGKNVSIVEPVNIYGSDIASSVFIGPFVEIQNHVKVGRRTRIQSHTFICELVEIGDECFIGHGVMFINDLFANGGPARGDKSLWVQTKVGSQVSIGSNATILPLEICDNVIIGAGAVVTKDITQSGIYAGNPARKIKDLKSNG